MTISVVITGASGFIGRALCEKLEEKKEYKIIKVTSSQNQMPGFYQVSNYRQSPPGDILIHLGEDSDRARVNQAGDFYREDTGQVMEALLKKRYKKLALGKNIRLGKIGNAILVPNLIFCYSNPVGASQSL